MSDKIPSIGFNSKRSNRSVGEDDNTPAEKKSKAVPDTLSSPLTPKEIKKRIERLQQDSTPFLGKSKKSGYVSQAPSMPDWMKGRAPTLAEIEATGHKHVPKPSTKEEWAALEKEFDEVAFELSGRRSRS